MKKVVLKLDLHDEKGKKKVMKIVSGIEGTDSITVDMKDKKLTVTGDIDPVNLVSKLRKVCDTDILSVGPAKEEKKDEKKKEEPKKEEPKKVDDNKKKEENKVYPIVYYPQPPPMPYPRYRSIEEDPNGCVIC